MRTDDALFLGMGIIIMFTLWGPWVQDAHAIPAFARKYQVNCNVCHTRWPRLNSFGEQFLENGYQMPGTHDGGIAKKVQLGDVTLDDVSNYIGFLFDVEPVKYSALRKNIAGAGDQTELANVSILRMFTAGTLTDNVGFLADLTSLFSQSSDFELGRAFLSFNNLGGMNWGHLRVGRLDPSAFFSMATDRPQFFPVAPKVGAPFGAFGPSINRWGLFPSAAASKFYGIFDRNMNPIFPFAPTLYNTDVDAGIDLHGRPFGDWFLYQVGVTNGGGERWGDTNNSKDWYVMTRFDYAQSDYFSANLSGFAYFGNHNAKVLSGADVSRSRYGVGARVRYKWLDLYGAYTIDRITDLPDGLAATFDATATGVTVEAHVIVTGRLLLGAGYNHLDAGGVLSERASATFLSLQARYYLRSNIALQMRNDVNVREAEGGNHAARNLRNNFVTNIAIAF
ncbi:MAG: hypothetical protein KC643_19710 [Nitrospira sp.]|nr:hypothetical protein [Nitrospira sp.]